MEYREREVRKDLSAAGKERAKGVEASRLPELDRKQRTEYWEMLSEMRLR